MCPFRLLLVMSITSTLFCAVGCKGGQDAVGGKNLSDSLFPSESKSVDAMWVMEGRNIGLYGVASDGKLKLLKEKGEFLGASRFGELIVAFEMPEDTTSSIKCPPSGCQEVAVAYVPSNNLMSVQACPLEGCQPDSPIILQKRRGSRMGIFYHHDSDQIIFVEKENDKTIKHLKVRSLSDGRERQVLECDGSIHVIPELHDKRNYFLDHSILIACKNDLYLFDVNADSSEKLCGQCSKDANWVDAFHGGQFVVYFDYATKNAAVHSVIAGKSISLPNGYAVYAGYVPQTNEIFFSVWSLTKPAIDSYYVLNTSSLEGRVLNLDTSKYEINFVNQYENGRYLVNGAKYGCADTMSGVSCGMYVHSVFWLADDGSVESLDIAKGGYVDWDKAPEMVHYYPTSKRLFILSNQLDFRFYDITLGTKIWPKNVTEVQLPHYINASNEKLDAYMGKQFLMNFISNDSLYNCSAVLSEADIESFQDGEEIAGLKCMLEKLNGIFLTGGFGDIFYVGGMNDSARSKPPAIDNPTQSTATDVIAKILNPIMSP